MTTDTMTSNGWVADRTGITMTTVDGVDVDTHISLALRINPKRAHLLVSSILGKHVPVEGWTFNYACHLLSQKVRNAIPRGFDPVVMGYAETAVGMGHAVADQLSCDYFQSTRHHLPMDKYVEFSEPHSHASEHYAYVSDPQMVAPHKIVVLVDDEVSTGVTVANTIRALHAKAAHPGYVVATFLDARTTSTALEDVSDELGVPVSVVSLTRAHVDLPEGIIETAAQILKSADNNERLVNDWETGNLVYLPPVEDIYPLPSSVAGVDVDQTQQVKDYAVQVAQAVTSAPGVNSLLDPHVVGVEEDTFLAARVAMSLRGTFSSTTRSPIFTVDDPDYPVRWKHEFLNADDEVRWAYNLPVGGDRILLLPHHTEGVAAERLIAAMSKGCDNLFIVNLPKNEQ